MNPKPGAGFLFCCGREHRTRMGVEAGEGTDNLGTETSGPLHVAAAGLLGLLG